MNCIGLKCKYCHKHDFRLSYVYCGLDRVGFKKDNYNNHECSIDDEITVIKEYLHELYKAKENITSNQNNK